MLPERQSREELIRNTLHIEQFDLPDGLNCQMVFIKPKKPDIHFLKSYLRTIVDNVLSTGIEHRLISDNPQLIHSARRFLESKNLGLQLFSGGTTFFEYYFDFQISQPWLIYQNNFYIQRVGLPDRIGLDYLNSLMLGSFNDENIISAINNPRNQVYLIYQQKPDDNFDIPYASFTLREIPILNEVQLHSVAGRGGKDVRISQEKGKMPIIISAMFNVIQQNYGKNVPQRLTFSSSGASKLYREIGFQTSFRDGLVIKNSQF